MTWVGKQEARFHWGTWVCLGSCPLFSLAALPTHPQVHSCTAEASDQFHRAPSGCPKTNQQKLATLGSLPDSELVNNSPRKTALKLLLPTEGESGIYRDFQIESVGEIWFCIGGGSLFVGWLWERCAGAACVLALGGWTWLYRLCGLIPKSQPTHLAFPLVAWRILDDNTQALFWKQGWRGDGRAVMKLCFPFCPEIVSLCPRAS